MKSELVNDYAELQQSIRELRKKHPGSKFVFRGQLKLHGGQLVPSIARPGHESYLQNQHDAWYSTATDILFHMALEYHRWRTDRSKQERRKRRSSKVQKQELQQPNGGKIRAGGTIGTLIEELLQHYGARSHYVDVTKSLSVGLWFGHHQFRMEEVPLLPETIPNLRWPLDPYGPMPVYDVAWYEPAWPHTKCGYLLVLSVKPAEPEKGLRHGDFIDLEPNYMASRVMRQKAGLVFADRTVNSGDLAKFVHKVFRFRLPLAGAPSLVTQTKTLTMFPSPDKDTMYREILSRMPFLTDIEKFFTLRRVLRIPEYCQSYDFLGSREWSLFRSYDRYFQRPLFFPLLAPLEGPILISYLDEDQFKLQDAIPVLCPFSVHMLKIPTTNAEIQFNDDGRGFFFEYDPIQVGVISEERYSPENARGIWIIRKGDRFWCRVFRRDPEKDASSIQATSGHVFLLTDGKGLSLEGHPPGPRSIEEYFVEEEQDALRVALGLLIDVSEGRRRLIPASEPYLMLTEKSIRY